MSPRTTKALPLCPLCLCHFASWGILNSKSSYTMCSTWGRSQSTRNTWETIWGKWYRIETRSSATTGHGTWLGLYPPYPLDKSSTRTSGWYHCCIRGTSKLINLPAHKDFTKSWSIANSTKVIHIWIQKFCKKVLKSPHQTLCRSNND